MDVKLTKREVAGLVECARWPDGMHVHWKPGTMAKLEAKGLVVKVEGCRSPWDPHRPFTGWRLTDTGRASLSPKDTGGEDA